MMQNKDEYQKSVQLKFRYCLGVLEFRSSWSFDYMRTGGGDRLRNRPFSHISGLRDFDVASGYMAYCRVALIDIYLHTRFHSTWTSVLWMYIRIDLETICIRSTRRNWSNEVIQSRAV